MRRRHVPAVCGLLMGLAPKARRATAAEAEAEAGDHWFIFLERGRKTPADREAVAAMQRGHIDNFRRLFALGRLFGAGPLRDPAGVKRGIVTVRAASHEELLGCFAASSPMSTCARAA